MRPLDAIDRADFVVVVKDRKFNTTVDKFYFAITDKNDPEERAYGIRWVAANFPEYMSTMNYFYVNRVVNGKEASVI